ncbi:hypothetical protein KI387_027560 [Taxus chinensis]|uniref:Uncharacterized protein n=1 Tax=Taxus chinensis TaxID=29808 RepID=A0AA38FZ97_TAXCH|nr:hypothetical protein KI387_027560 [Taxus chinensis]
MATAAFKSTTKRYQENNSNSAAGGHRRSRSLSHFGRYNSEISSSAPSALRQNKIHINDQDEDQELNIKPPSRNVSPPRESSVTETRGFASRRGRSVSRYQTESANDSQSETEKKLQRGRSVIRNGVSRHTVNPTENGRRRQRSVSVARHYQYSDSTSESDMDRTYNWTGSNRLNSNATKDGQRHTSEKLSGGGIVKPQRGLRRCSSQTDLLRSYDNHSSYGSSLTDDEGLDVTHGDQGEEKIIRAVYAQMKTSVKKNTPLTTSKGSNDLLKPNSPDVRKNHTAKLEQSEKRARNLRTELAVEEHRRQELTKVLKELLSGTKPAQMERPSRRRRNSADRKQLSKALNEEAQNYIDEFLSMSNIEDSEFSSSFEEEQYNTGAHGRKIEDNGLCQDSLLHVESTEKCLLSAQHVPLSVEE